MAYSLKLFEVQEMEQLNDALIIEGMNIE